jgi:hypothetical protein
VLIKKAMFAMSQHGYNRQISACRSWFRDTT